MKMPMSVLQIDTSGKISLECIDIMDVDFIENDGRRVVYHIGDERYYQITNKSELEDVLLHQGFDILDRPYLVNMKKIQYYDPQLGKVYFVPMPDKNSKFATVARMKLGVVEKFIKRIVSHNQGTTEEFKSQVQKSSLFSVRSFFQRGD